MALTFVSYQILTTQRETATAFDGTGLAEDSLTKICQAVGTKTLSASRTAKATINVTGADEETAVTTVNIEVTPTIGTLNPLTEAEVTAYGTFLDDVVTTIAAVEGGIVWGGE